MSDQTAVMEVKKLGVSYRVDGEDVPAVRDFEMTIRAGEIVGIVGESGSGKTTVARALMRYLAENGTLAAGSEIRLLDEDLCQLNQREMRRVWGRRMTLVPQNPGSALNPSLRVGAQVAEILEQHSDLSDREIQEEVVAALAHVNLADPEKLAERYPHELSGGQQQRIAIAMALITAPQLLILDEPTTAVDVTTEAVILDLVRDLIKEENTGALYVTHNMGVVAQICEQVIVMYAGEIMEIAPVETLFEAPLHPYTIGLLNSIPQPRQTKRERPLQTIPGRPPALDEMPPGCVFEPRCPLAIEVCKEKPPLEGVDGERRVRCHRWEEIASGEVARGEIFKSDEAAIVTGSPEEDRERLLRVENLTKHFTQRRSLLDILRGERPNPLRALDGANLSVQKGRTYGLVGESGSGKTTLARVVIGLTERTEGEIELLGADIRGDVTERPQEVLADLQMIFQNPQNTLNPYLTVGQAIRRPLVKLGGYSREAAEREVQRLLEAVNLRSEYASRTPNELSGGEKQRVAVARAFASNPALILCDEPVTSLDVSVQSAVLNLLARLQEENETSYIFISHDLAVVGYLSDYVAVMYLGKLFEVGYAKDLFTPPMNPYTEALVSAIPVADPARKVQTVRLEGDIPSPQDVPSGCPFHTRCPRKIGPICEEEEPPWRELGKDHYSYCHYEKDELIDRQKAFFSEAEAQ